MLIISPPAIEHFKDQLEKSDAIGISLGLAPAGCNGFKYEVELFYELDTTSKVIDMEGISIAVKEKDSSMLLDLMIDFVKDGVNRGLTFKNPFFDKSCGCGESFSSSE